MDLQMMEKLKNGIINAEIVSFDIYDTLITRIVDKPEDIFMIIEQYYNIEDFYHKRVEYQNRASKKLESEKGYPHADINEIYDFIAKTEKNDINWDDIKKFELELEYDSTFCISEMKEIYDYAISLGKKVIAVSDMYIRKNDLVNILQKCGYLYFDEIYVSADIRKAKFNGELFDYILDKESIKADRILHIGDNIRSDYEIPKGKGISVISYITAYNNKMEHNGDGVFCSIDRGINHYFDLSVKDNYWFNLGRRMGGSLYLGLLNWFQQKLEEVKYNNIYFLSRDGYILYNIMKELEIPNIHYILTSRRALLLAGIDKIDDEALRILPPYTFGQTIKEVLEYICCEDISDEAIISAGFKSKEDKITKNEDHDKFKRLYIQNEKFFLARFKKEREYAIKYLSQLNFFDSNSIVFDCGWNGSSQYLLNRLINTINCKDDNYFLYAGIMDTPKARKQLEKLRYDSYLFNINKNADIEKSFSSSIVIPELFFGANHNSVWKYDEKGVVFDAFEKDHMHKQDIFSGVLEYIKIAKPYIDKYNIKVEPSEASENIITLINKPSMEDAVNIGNLMNVDGFVKQKGKDKYVANIKISDLLKNRKLEIYWPQALLKRDDIDLIVKLIIRKKYGVSNKTRFIRKKVLYSNLKPMRALKVLKKEGIITFMYLLNNKFKKINNDTYNTWIKRNENYKDSNNKLEYSPLISIVVPVYNVIDKQLTECINSVIYQTYKNWELCLVDDASTWPSVKTVLHKYEKKEKIKILYRQENGHISRATNDGIRISSGEFVAFLDCDDVLAPNALYEMAKKLNENRKFDFIYSDEDKLSPDGKRRHDPFFKPDWSPDTFLSLMYTCHFAMYRRTIIDEVNGLRIGLEGAQDYDFTLRFTEKTKLIGHIPKILYHWRERAESIASNPEAKKYALDAVKKAKEDALERRGLTGTVEYVSDMYQYRVKYVNKANPLVSIIIPSKNNYSVLYDCIKTLKQYTRYQNYEILLIDNGSDDDNHNKYKDLSEQYNILYYYSPMNFNFSKMCNIGASLSKGSLLLFMNDDIEIISEDWLEILVGHASIEYVGAVGAKLIYPNTNIIQHIGITNLKIGPSHSQIGFDDSAIYYYGRNRMDYNNIAVTGACLMVEKSKFEQIGGFDELLTIGYNDVDLCFKLLERGFYNVVRNDVKLYHHESISRGSDDASHEKKERLRQERNLLYSKHPNYKGEDPFYNPNLTESRVDFELNILDLNKYNRCNKYFRDFKTSWISNKIQANIDSIMLNDNHLVIDGWAFINNYKLNNTNKIFIILFNEGEKYIVETTRVFRPDVTNEFQYKSNLNFSGFKTIIESDVIKGKYQVGILIKTIFNFKHYIISDKYISF